MYIINKYYLTTVFIKNTIDFIVLNTQFMLFYIVLAQVTLFFLIFTLFPMRFLQRKESLVLQKPQKLIIEVVHVLRFYFKVT